MAKGQQQSATGHWFLDAVPIFVVVLMAAHVLALVYWMYRLATDKQQQQQQSQRKKLQ